MVKVKKKIRKTKKKVEPMNSTAAAIASVLGSDSVYTGGDSDLGEPKMFVDSEVPSLNEVLDRQARGWPSGRIVELYGGEATAKSGVLYALLSATQKAGGEAVLYPVEDYDEWLCQRYGVDTDKLILAEALTVEKVFRSVMKVVKTSKSKLIAIGIDSIAALMTKKEYEEESFDRDRAAMEKALLLAKAFRKVTPEVHKTNVILFCVNQVRDATDPQGKAKPKSPGGRSLKHLASIRLRMEILGKFYKQKLGVKRVGGLKLRITAEKNRLAQPFQQANILLDYDKGLLPAKSKS